VVRVRSWPFSLPHSTRSMLINPSWWVVPRSTRPAYPEHLGDLVGKIPTFVEMLPARTGTYRLSGSAVVDGSPSRITSHCQSSSAQLGRKFRLFASTFYCVLSTFLLFEYRIEAQPNDRPPPIGSLQNGNAANPWHFRSRPALSLSGESRRQTCYRTSRRASRRFPGSALGSSPEACSAAVRRAAAADRSSLARPRSEYLASSRNPGRPRHCNRGGNGQAVVLERILFSQSSLRREYSRLADSLGDGLTFPIERLLGLRAKISLRRLPARIRHRFGQVENRLWFSRRETSYGRKPLQSHGV
jgi:hypothetical protein